MTFKTSTVNDFHSEEEIESAPEVSKAYSDLVGTVLMFKSFFLYSGLQIKCLLCLELQYEATMFYVNLFPTRGNNVLGAALTSFSLCLKGLKARDNGN